MGPNKFMKMALETTPLFTEGPRSKHLKTSSGSDLRSHYPFLDILIMAFLRPAIRYKKLRKVRITFLGDERRSFRRIDYSRPD